MKTKTGIEKIDYLEALNKHHPMLARMLKMWMLNVPISVDEDFAITTALAKSLRVSNGD